MKGLAKIPDHKNLLRAYSLLQTRKSALTEPQLLLYSQWTRFDARLMEQLIVHIARFWREFSVIRLNTGISKQVWPQCLAVCLEQGLILVNKDKRLYKNWVKAVLTGVRVAPYQSYFIGIRSFASEYSRVAAASPVRAFSKWGFAESELQINKITTYPSESFSSVSRENLLKKHMSQSKEARFQLIKYLELCKFSISRRQAQRDLKSFRWIKAFGSTKGRFYLARAK